MSVTGALADKFKLSGSLKDWKNEAGVEVQHKLQFHYWPHEPGFKSETIHDKFHVSIWQVSPTWAVLRIVSQVEIMFSGWNYLGCFVINLAFFKHKCKSDVETQESRFYTQLDIMTLKTDAPTQKSAFLRLRFY